MREPDTTKRLTKKMIEAGAKAAYGTIFSDPENWPDVGGSVKADEYRKAAKNRCYVASSPSRKLKTSGA